MEQSEEKKLHYRNIKEEQGKELIEWWRDLLTRNGPRAALNRCSYPDEVALHPDTFRVKGIVPWMSYEAAAVIAGILSHVREKDNRNMNRNFAATLALVQEGGRPSFSETRFRQFLSSRDWNEFYTRLRRAVKMLHGNVNPLSVADIVLRWDEEQRWGSGRGYGHSLKFDLSNEYYTQLEKNNY